MLVTTEAIILRTRKQGDTSKIITIFSLDYGKINLIAKGVRKSSKKAQTFLEPTTHAFFSFYKKNNSDLFLLTKSDPITIFGKIFESYELMTNALTILESVIICFHNDAPNETLFQLLLESIKILNEKCNFPQSLLVAYQLKFAELLGFNFQLENIICNEIDDYYISLEYGTVCKGRNSGFKNFFSIDYKILLKFKNIFDNSLNSANLINLSDLEKNQIQNLFSLYFSFHLEQKFVLNTLKLMK